MAQSMINWEKTARFLQNKVSDMALELAASQATAHDLEASLRESEAKAHDNIHALEDAQKRADSLAAEVQRYRDDNFAQSAPVEPAN